MRVFGIAVVEDDDEVEIEEEELEEDKEELDDEREELDDDETDELDDDVLDEEDDAVGVFLEFGLRVFTLELKHPVKTKSK